MTCSVLKPALSSQQLCLQVNTNTVPNSTTAPEIVNIQNLNLIFQHSPCDEASGHW